MENRLDLFNKTYNTLVTAWENIELLDGLTANEYECDSHNLHQFQMMAFQVMSGSHSRSEIDLIAKAFGVHKESKNWWEFEEVPFANRNSQYIGLCAVMEVLWEIHGIQDRSLTTLNAIASDKGVTVNA